MSDTFEKVINDAPRELGQEQINDLFNTLASQSKTILLQKKQIEYLVAKLKTILPSAGDQPHAHEDGHAHEEAPAPAPAAEVTESANASTN